MKILVINCGSSSLKFQLITSEDMSVMMKGVIERIGLEDTNIEWSLASGEKFAEKFSGESNHKTALELLFKKLTDPEKGTIKSVEEIGAIGHRVVHGGEKFNSSIIIDDDVLENIKKCSSLAPLHNPPNIMGIEAAAEILGKAKPQAAVFDTAFHSKMPMHAALYPLPYSFYTKHQIRRYGFHGTSHKFVAQTACRFLNLPPDSGKVISCHIGNGASIAAVKGSASVDTSMGLTPLEGVVMGTRCGDLDPAITFHLIENCGYTSKELNEIYNSKSGLLGISQLSGDMRDIIAAMDKGNEQAKLAYDIFCYRIKKYIGAYFAVLNGADAIVFTAGVAENNDIVRRDICKDLDRLGIEIDGPANVDSNRKTAVISKKELPCKVMVVPTNEELMIASETMALVGSKG